MNRSGSVNMWKIGDDVAVLRVRDAANGKIYDEMLAGLDQIRAEGVQRLVLDLSEVYAVTTLGLLGLCNVVLRFAGCSMVDPEMGWDALHRMSDALPNGAGRGKVALVASEAVKSALAGRWLETCGPLHDSVAEAVSAFGTAPADVAALLMVDTAVAPYTPTAPLPVASRASHLGWLTALARRRSWSGFFHA